MSERDILQRIATSTQRFIVDIAHWNPSHHNSVAPVKFDIPPLRLAKSTSHFQSELSRNGLLPHVCRVAMMRAAELANVYQTAYEGACRRLMDCAQNQDDPPISELFVRLRQTLEHLYEQKDLSNFLAKALRTKTFPCMSDNYPVDTHKERKPFNHVYTPFLEKYFEQNAYPSTQDRKILAQKTMMTPRQIEVWFQNHRNRARKDGTILKRFAQTPLDFPLDYAFSSPNNLRTDRSSSAVPSEVSIRDDDAMGEGSGLTENDSAAVCAHPQAFTTTRPPHAFPNTYPSNCGDDPFPNDRGVFKFPPPVWIRRPASSRILSNAIDMDEIIHIFSTRLHLREGLSKKQGSRKAQIVSESGSWCASMITYPSPAPHPALIRTPSQPLNPISILPMSPTSIHNRASPSLSPLPSQGHARAHPSPMPHPALIRAPFQPRYPTWISPVFPTSSDIREAPSLSHLPSQGNAWPRKAAPLPKRTPATSFNVASSSAFSTFASRASSLSSVASSQSRLASTSSLSSIEPETPPLSPMIRPHETVFTEQDFQVLDELFGSASDNFLCASSQNHDFSITDLVTKNNSTMTSYMPSGFGSFNPTFIHAQS